MRPSPLLLLIAVLALSACDKITGAGEKKEADAASVGFACRVSFKAPEDCMKDNATLSPTSILTGWKAADKEINTNLLDPMMKKNNPSIPPKPVVVPVAPVAASAAAEAMPKAAKGAAKTKSAAH
ncbi:MAG: hypothetical protein Q8O24_00285 [Gallionellaceae bacterium]|nr:hypothetical protein [Gallionellaceae bacterium]